MNALAFEYVKPNSSFPWFDDYSKHNTFCKVYNDGSCYIAVPSDTSLRPKKSRSYCRMPIDDLFDQLYLQAIKDNIARKDIAEYILTGICEQYPDKWGLTEYVDKKLISVYRNLAARKKRFRRKAFLNPWNYFVTFTYNNELQDEESFKKRLRKCLSNLHTRRGWLYMGVFERAPETGRLHLHAVMYVPEGQMIGEIYERRDYSTRNHKMQVTHSNTFFERNFGRNDFEALSNAELRRGTTMNYLLKYLEKSNERIIYSRGIPSEFYKEINDNDVICEMVDFVTKYVLFNDVVDYETDVKHIRRAPTVFYIEPLPS
ncbi:MAG: hypothetical protein IJY65_05495 [Clostridia bacterium]|nr:hypothetical protein [Clostridia bacterium]